MDRFLTLIVCGCEMIALWIIALGLIFSDLWSGVRKAKQMGVFRTSEGYKKTIDKIARYFNMLLPLALMDIAINGGIFYLHYFYECDFVMFPWVTAIGTGYIAWVELHSIMEPADIKERKNQQDYLRALKVILAGRDPKKIIEDISTFGTEKEAEDESKSDTNKQD